MPTDPPPTRTVLDEEATAALVERLADEIRSRASGPHPLVLVGIQRRGDSIARRIAEILAESGSPVPTGSLDITLYRDDFARVGSRPVIGTTELPHDITDAHVVVVDDVIYTGRTIRAAINELGDFGRAAKVELCVLVDRGGRELPIQPDFAGRVMDVAEGEQVSVRVGDLDGSWGVDVVSARTTGEEAS